MTKGHTVSVLHQQLREATRAHHHNLDHHPLLSHVTKESLTVEIYGQILSGLYGVYQTLESGIDDFLAQRPGFFDYESRRKLPALDNDLRALGLAPPSTPMDFPPPTTIGAWVGMIYTVEGSTLGGQVIAQIVEKKGLPTRFFSGYGKESSSRWAEVLTFTDTVCPHEEYPLATETAAKLFRSIIAHLDTLESV